MKNLNYYLNKARKEGWAIGQFNFSNLETLKAVIGAAKKSKSPVILGTSEGESSFVGLKQAVALVKSYREETGLPLFLNLDHGKSFSYIKEAIDSGYDTVHFDGSGLPLAENIKETVKVLKYAKKFKVFVEGEVGVIGQASESKETLTDVAEALEFARKTGVDRLAVSIGSVHGIEKGGINPGLNLERLAEIRKALKDIPLVLHGGSGTPEEDVRKAIRIGMAKVNINTELRMAYTENLRASLDEKKDENTPYKYMSKAIEAVQRIVEGKIKLFSSDNKI
ncbi:MAG: ketose-bisphosphate aldolase [Candidatus Nealsonbacteria bacterium CG07_land_8_20_14_0_80_39_13]|nr:MAG: ketose-bisphosphate aldolase [Candidatus Nealsonbacteria bacterium CG07_land_8_20_14_0_80_39_13]